MLIAQELDRFTGRQHVFEIAEIEQRDDLFGGEIGQQAPKRNSPGLCPQVEAGVGDRCERQMNHTLVRPEPAKLMMVAEPREDTAELPHDFFDFLTLQRCTKHLDCPADASWFNGLSANEKGAPVIRANMACLFERNVESPAWRHGEGDQIYGRPTRQLVLRSAAVIGNYDYIMDWRFDPDGTIDVAVGATGIIETRAMTEEAAPDHAGHDVEQTGQFVAANTLGVNHDHYFSFRLDLDVDGPSNSFMIHRMVRKQLENDPMRKSIWVAKPSIAKREQDAILDIQLERPSMWMFMNPAVKGPQNYSTAYEVMPGATAKSLMSPDDPVQKVGAFSEHQFWVTPYDAGQVYASGTYPTFTNGEDGLAVWTKANRTIVNTDIVGWYTLGFHHIPRAEDWPVMPTMWHHFQIRPFHFFEKNPVLDLPKSIGAAP